VRSTHFQLFILTVGFGLVGCGSSGSSGPGAGGDQGVGGSAAGGVVGTGGAPVSTGGITSAGPTGGMNALPTGGSTNGVNPTGGKAATGGSDNGGPTGGKAATGGAPATGGSINGTPTGGKTGGGGVAATGGSDSGSPTGGKTGGGGVAATGGSNTGSPTGGKAAGGAATGGAATGGQTSGGGGTPNIGKRACDIYKDGGTACVAAYSTTRLLLSTYTGKLYQVRKGGSAGTGGTTTDIGITSDGYADGAAHDAACGTSGCTFSILYDQSGKGNDLKVAPAGCYSGTASSADFESNALKKSITISGHKVYALYTAPQEGYRNNTGAGMPTGTATGQGIYMVADGTRTGTAAGSACCFDFGNASKNNCNGGTMNALFFGTGYWGKGAGSGPWFLADLEGGVWAGGSGASNAVNSSLPSSNVPFAFGVLSSSGSSNYAIRVGNATSGALTTASDGATPKSLSNQGGIILGIGGDNSNSSQGTFFEGVITTGKPTEATDKLVLANVQAAKYGQ